MLAGHFAVGLAAKRLAPSTSLGTLTLASMAPDLVLPIFVLAGIDQVRFGQGLGAAEYFIAEDVGWSHSLVMCLVWGALLFGVLAFSRQSSGAIWVVPASTSHWILDAISHQPDMPIIPGGAYVIGFGLWSSIPATLLIEGGLWLAAIALYVRTTEPRGRSGNYGFWVVVMIITLLWYNNIAGPPPPDPRTAPIASLVVFSLLVVWAYWMECARVQRED